MKYAALLALAVILAAARLNPAAELRLSLGSDSVIFSVGDHHSPVALTDIGEQDTARIWEAESALLHWDADTLVVRRGDSRYHTVVLEGASRTRRLTLWFYRTRDRLDDMVALLRQYPDFGESRDSMPGPRRPMTTDHHELDTLCEAFHLDSIAGEGSESDRAVRLLRWLHDRARHNGSSPSPSGMTTAQMIGGAADSGLTFNCGALANIYNDVCLAAGLKARRLVCMPADKDDPDCHSVNLIWSAAQNKWLLMDPTNRCWFTDVAGTVLSPAEIRQGLIDGDSVLVCDEIDYNGAPRNPVEYKGYMAKNLFRFIVWARIPAAEGSAADTRDPDTKAPLWRIHLNPTGYDPDSTGVTVPISDGSSQRFAYYTDNAAWFWRF